MSEEFEVNEVEEEGESLLDMLGISPSAPMEQASLSVQTIRIQSSAGGVIDVPTSEDHMVDGVPGYRLADVLDMANLTVSPSTQYWLGETQINPDTVVAPGAVVTAIGLMKGG